MSPSNHAWVNYDEDKLKLRYVASRAARRGSDLHKLAHDCITLGIKMASVKGNRAFAAYVNDGIGYKMSSEQTLYYSENCFGTADSIIFRRGKLRIHDLKTGIGPTKMRQLEVYAALFCLEYHIDPFEIEIELRIYQGDNVTPFEADPQVIYDIMEIIIEQDARINHMRTEELL